jgi:hypothetical protein
MKIAVNRNDIAKGMPGISWGCPVALAIIRALGLGRGHIMLGTDKAHILRPDDGIRSLDLPPEVQTWIRKFDRGETVEPFEFELVA